MAETGKTQNEKSRKSEFLKAIAIATLVYLGIQYFMPSPTNTAADALMNKSGMKPFLEAAYNAPQALKDDLQELNRRRAQSPEAGTEFFIRHIYPKALAIFADAVANAPGPGLREYFKLDRELSTRLRKEAPELCLQMRALDKPSPTINQTVATGNTLKKIPYIQDINQKTLAAQAEIIKNARNNPTPLPETRQKAILTYALFVKRVLEDTGRHELSEKISNGTLSGAEACDADIISSTVALEAPEKYRLVVMKGALLAGLPE